VASYASFQEGSEIPSSSISTEYHAEHAYLQNTSLVLGTRGTAQPKALKYFADCREHVELSL